MKNIRLVSALTATLLCGFTVSAHAFRCGEGNRYLATEGMHKYQILKDCGPPDVQEDTGVDKNIDSYRVMEEWVYIVEENGNRQMYLIKFDKDGIAEKIQWLGKQN